MSGSAERYAQPPVESPSALQVRLLSSLLRELPSSTSDAVSQRLQPAELRKRANNGAGKNRTVQPPIFFPFY
jgi:hypothetical protein